jgi:hypothetical protein
MRRLTRALAAVLAVLMLTGLATGCYVFDELDKSQAMLDHGAKAKKEKAEANAAAAKAKAEKQNELEERVSHWWEGARTLSSSPQANTADPAIGCRIGSALRFMRRSDCLSQGGHPSS